MLDRRSPMDLREGLETLEPYQPPRMLIRQGGLDSMNDDQQVDGQQQYQQRQQQQREQQADIKQSKRRWLPKLSQTKRTQNERLSKLPERLASLDSTQSNSSMEFEASTSSGRHDARQHTLIAPLISITSNDSSIAQPCHPNRIDWRNKRHLFSNERRGAEFEQDDEDDNEDDAFDQLPLPIPYSSTAMSRSNIIRQQTENGVVSFPTSYEDLLDDRQGMNNSEQHFTKGEKANRSSIDGSITSDLRMDSKKFSAKPNKRDKQRRIKSPSSSSLTRRRQSKRAFLSRFKLTKKHESIAKLQLSILNSGFVSLKTLDKDLQSFLPQDRLSIKAFQERVRLLRKFEVLSTIEYRFASKYETYVCKHAQQETNHAKNNYKKCIPYDYNRVVLRTLPNVPDSDYINASHVDSLLKPNAYIAAQGPNENTIEDFWRMIWEQKTFVVVMLTKVFDFIRVMCNQYWPVEVNKPERYGNVEVTLLYEEPLADFVIRTIRLVRLKGAPTQDNKAEIEEQDEDEANRFFGDTMEADTKVDVDKAIEDVEDVDLSDETGTESYEDDDEQEEDLIINDAGKMEGSLQNLNVRSPRFVAAKSHSSGISRRGRSISPRPRSRLSANRLDITSTKRAPRASPQSNATPSGPSLWVSLAVKRRSSAGQKSQTKPQSAEVKRSSQQQNDFLHPAFANSTLHLGSTSLNSLQSEPNTPLTPRTPSSAGLDRSSATRKAVKKKRRERIKNQRPRRTQFMVPTESQLQDDDDEGEMKPSTADETTAGFGKSSERIVYQFHYNSWASHTCPSVSSLLHFRRRVRICMDEMSKSGKTGPTVVHCNDGCGRTGAYLCIDANLELAEEDNVLDVYHYTRKMRQSRKFLLENLEQYKFVYDTIDEALFCGRTWFPISDLHKRLKHKSQRNPLTKKNEYLVEYEKICRKTSKFSIGDCAGGHRVENREKNRDVSTVPPDNFRPYLTSFQTNDSTDYINAVFVDGYTRSKEYIVTEWPLHRTISDFWSLVYDHDCNSVILLANPSESSTYPSFLPSEKELRRKFGPVFSAEMVSYTHYQNIKSWIYTINKKIVSLTEVIAGVKSEAKTTQVFQITCWPQGHRVPTSTNALVELMNMVERWRQRTTYGPVCVVSLNGKSRAGVYCAANVAIEQVVQHSEVDVFNAVKTVRRYRPQLIENMTEYKYCYDLILHYVLHYVNNQSLNSN